MFTRLKRIWDFIRRITDAHQRHFGPLMAAAFSFYLILSAVPLLSVAVAVLGWVFGGSEEALMRTKDILQDYLPTSGAMIYETLSEIKRNSGLIGLIGLAGLLVTGSAIFINMEVALNNIWGVQKMRPWWKQYLVAIGTTLLTLSLLFSSLAVTSLLTYIQNVTIPGVDYRASQIPFLWQIVGNLVPLLLSILLFAVVYKIVPNKPIQWREAFLGGAFAGIAFELAKYLFALYLARFNNYNKVYGSLGGLIILVVWTYYSMTILLIGAEIAADSGTKLPAAEQPPKNVPLPQSVEE